MNRVLRVLGWGLVIVLVLLLATGGGGYIYMRQSLPRVAGTITLSGVQAEIQITRDTDAVPHIYAQSKHDALFGLGYVHAQDRLWQMEFQRRIGAGRLSEIIGEPTVGTDQFLRTIGIFRAAQSAWDTLAPTTKAQVEAYVAGINAFLQTHRGSQLPPEFTILGVTPEPWTGVDVIVWSKVMAFDSSANFGVEMLRSDLIQTVGPERTEQLLQDSTDDALTIIKDAAALHQPPYTPARAQAAATVQAGRPLLTEQYAPLIQIEKQMRSLLGVASAGRSGLGSNSWVISGAKSVTGKPILANDPHLGARIPSTWYMAHLSAGQLDVIGATIPGLPAVVIGRNSTIAWGVTNMFPDVQDMFRERLDSTGRLVEFEGQMEPLRVITETIRVKGQPDQQLPVRLTRHGPLLSDLMNLEQLALPEQDRIPERAPLALSWTSLAAEDGTVEAFLQLNEARNWDEFRSALSGYVGPAQNFIYADTAGNIGYSATGRIPIRAAGDGATPAEGWTGANEWTGMLPFDALPTLYNPADGIIITANNRPAPTSYPHFLGQNWEQPLRAQRINDLLMAKDKLSVEDIAAMQGDTISLQARDLLPSLLKLTTPANELEQEALDLLKAWDGDTRGDSAAAAIFAAWLYHLPNSLVSDELGPRLTGSFQELADLFVGRFVATTLRDQANPWCDRVDTASSETCADIADQTLQQALADLTERQGANIQSWRWDRLHTVVFAHQPLGEVPVVQQLFNRLIANGGDYSTINVGPFAFDGSFIQYSVPSYRQIIDLGQPDNDRFILAIGQSGHVLSPRYDDYLSDWAAVRYRPLRFRQASIEHEGSTTLRLVP